MMKQYVSFDIGRTLIKYGIVQEDFTILKQNEIENPIHQGLEEFKHFLLATIENLKKEYTLSGVCISTAGVVDTNSKKIEYANIPNYTNFSFQTEIEDKIHLPVSVENDVYCFALAESTKELHNYCMVTIGTGIGGAIVIDKKLSKGISKTAGSFGQMLLSKNKRLEDVASLKALLADAKQNGLYVKNGLELFQLYDKNNEVAKRVVHNFYQALATGLLNISYTLNPETILLAGGITTRDSFLAELQKEIKRLADPAYHTSTIALSTFSKEGGLLGALVYHLSKYQK